MQRAAILILAAFLLTFARLGVKVVTSAALDVGEKNDLGDPATSGLSMNHADTGKTDRKSFEISPEDESGMGHIADVIDALESLGVLSVTRENCYSLVDVVRTTSERDNDTGSRKISVAINLQELEQRQKLSPVRTRDGDITSSPTTASDHVTSGVTMTSRGGVHSGGVKECILPVGSVRKPSESGRVSGEAGESILTAEGGKEEEDQEEEQEEGARHNRTSGTSSNSSGVTRTKTGEEDGPRLSYTQVMVISTCSSVIGVFFIVAVIIRVKNYIKRVREEQAAARRPSFRSTSVSLRSNSQQNTNPHKDGRLEAALNKDRGDSVAMVMSCKEDPDEDGDITPKLTSQENRPLLIVTAASAPSSPCPQRARCDYQYSNGDDDETMTADENNCRGFMAKSAISNQYQPVSTAQTPPTNRHQRASRVHNNRNYTRVGCSTHRVPTSLQEEEDSGAESDGEQLGHVNLAMRVLSPATLEDESGCGTDIFDGTDDKGERLLSFGNRVSMERDELEDIEGDPSQCRRMVEWDVYDSFSEESFQKHSFDLDYCPSGVVRQGSGDPVLSSIPEGVDMDGVGFTQSDSSISSNNPSYRYGNQVEYTGVQQYPNVEYVPDAHYDSASTESNVTVIHVSQEIPRPPRYMSQESTDSNIVIRQVSDDSLLYNESPPLRKRFTHLQSSSLEDEKQDFWLEEEADDDDTSPNDVRDRFSFPNERFNFREERLPNIREGERLDHKAEDQFGDRQNYSPRMSCQGSPKPATLTRQKQSIRDDVGPDNSDTDLEARAVQPRGQHVQLNGEVASRSSDSDTSEAVSTNLLPPQQQQTRHRKKRHRRHRHNEGWSILQDPEFEGMQPTYV